MKLRKISWLGLLLAIGFSADQMVVAAPSLAVGQGAGTPNSFGTVPVTFTSDVSAVALQFDVQFDDSQLVAGTPSLGSLATKQLLASAQPTNGVLRIVVYSTSNVPLPSGLLLNLQFTGQAGASDGVFSLVPVNAIVANAVALAVTPVKLAAGSFSLTSALQARFGPISLQNGAAQLQLTGTAGQSFALQASVNLLDWISLNTNTIPIGGVLKFNDPAAQNFKARFYRAVQQ